MIHDSLMLTALFAFVAALAVSFAVTPAVKICAKHFGAVDVPKDNRRMHKVPIPRMGGLAIFLGFIISVLLFGKLDQQMSAILLGAVLVVILGIVDDKMALPPSIKFVGQIVAALIPALNGVDIERFTNPFADGSYFSLGIFSVPVTVIWIVNRRYTQK